MEYLVNSCDKSYDTVFLKQKLHSSRETHTRLVNLHFPFFNAIIIHLVLCKQESTGTKFIDLAEFITRVREPPKEEDDGDKIGKSNISDLEIFYNRILETTNTEDSLTSISSSTKPHKRKTLHPTNRWLSTVGYGSSGLSRYRRRVCEIIKE